MLLVIEYVVFVRGKSVWNIMHCFDSEMESRILMCGRVKIEFFCSGNTLTGKEGYFLD